MRTCPECQQPVEAGSKTCSHCGSPLSFPPPLPKAAAKPSVLTKAKQIWQRMLALAASTWRLVACKMRSAKTALFDLPSLHRQLGEHVESGGLFRDELDAEHRSIEDLRERIRALSVDGDAPTERNTNTWDKVRAYLRTLWSWLRAIPLEMQLRRSQRRLGAVAYAKHGDQAGPAAVVSQISERKSYVDNLAQQSRQLDERYAGRWLTPTRTAIAGAALLGLLGCVLLWRGAVSLDSGSPTHDAADKSTAMTSTDSEPTTTDHDFIQSNSFCRDVVNAVPLERFLRDTPGATLDRKNSVPGIGFEQYNESFFQYGFLDKRLVSITMLLPRDQVGIEREFVEYHDAFGPPDDTMIPAQMRANGATRHAVWNIPASDLTVSLTVQPSQSVGLVLVGFWRSTSKGELLLERLNSSDPSDTEHSKSDDGPYLVESRTGARSDHADPEPRGLARGGYTLGNCLLCFSRRSTKAHIAYSDRQGYGLCDKCGEGVLLLRRAQRMQEAGVVPPPALIQETRSFGAFVSTCFSRDDDDARRGLVLMVLAKFGSPEWDALTSGGE